MNQEEMLRRWRLARKELDRNRCTTAETERVLRKHGLDPNEQVEDSFVALVLLDIEKEGTDS
jgi:hypothetical protein